MAIVPRKAQKKVLTKAAQQSSLRVDGGQAGSGPMGQSLILEYPAILQSGNIVRGYQGSWPNPVDEGEIQYVQAFQFVSITDLCMGDNVQLPVKEDLTEVTRYFRTTFTGSGRTLGVTMEAAVDNYSLIKIKTRGICLLWVETDAVLRQGRRVGCQTAIQGLGNAIFDHLGPATLIRRILPLPWGGVDADRELWLVMLHGERGDSILIEKASTGEHFVASTVLFDDETYELTDTAPGEVAVDVV